MAAFKRAMNVEANRQVGIEVGWGPQPRGRILLVLMLLVAVIAAACGGGDSDDPTPDVTESSDGQSTPAVTRTDIDTPVASGSAAAGVSPTATLSLHRRCPIEVVAEPTPVRGSPPPASLPIGRTCRPDAERDPVDAAGAVVTNVPAGLDLVAVQIDGDGSRLVVHWVASARMPIKIEDGQAVWKLELLMAGQPVYELRVQLVPGDWDVIIHDVATGEEQKLRLASLFGQRLETPFPSDVIPKITGPFEWRASSEFTTADGGVYTDTLPDDVSTMEPFPDGAGT